MKYVGMDIHSKTTTFCVIDEKGHLVKRGKVESGEESWASIVATWPVEEVEVALETGTMSWWVVDVLREAGIDPVVVDARQFKLVSLSKKKSDKHDARALADALRGGLAQRCQVSVPSLRARRGRSLLRTRHLFVKQSVACFNGARGMLGSVGVSISKAQWKTEKGWENLLANPAIPAYMKPLLHFHREHWKHLESKRAELDALVKLELRHWPEAKILLEMPGFGPLVSLGVLSSLDDPKRFKRPGQVAAYAGIVPSSRDSGEATRRGGITHQGNSLLRHLMVQAAWAALRSKKLTPGLRKWTKKLMVKRGAQKAIVALSRRLLILAHRLWVNGEVYNPYYSRTVG